MRYPSQAAQDAYGGAEQDAKGDDEPGYVEHEGARAASDAGAYAYGYDGYNAVVEGR